MYCPSCGEEIQLIPDFEPEIENEIQDTLRNISNEGLDEVMKADTQEIPIIRRRESQKEEGFDEEYDGDFLDELEDFEDEEDVVKQIAVAIRESRFRWVYVVLVLLLVAGIIAAVYYISNRVYENNSSSYQASLAAASAAKGEYDDAIVYMEKAVMLDPENSNLKFVLVDYYFTNKEDEKALLLLWEVAYGKGSNSSTAYRRIIDYYEDLGDYATIQEILSNCEEANIRSQFTSYLANAPEFSYPSGTYEEVLNVAISSNTNGAIYYTLDGSVPTTESELYTSPINMQQGIFTLKAIFVNSYGIQSEVAEASYTIDIRIPDAPDVAPEAGEYTIPVWITATSSKYNTLYYTTDGSVPTSDSNEYINAIPMPIGHSHFTFIAYSQEGVAGEIREVEYDLKIKSDLEFQDILDRLKYYNYNTGKTIDEKGTAANGAARYSYSINSALTLRDYKAEAAAGEGVSANVSVPDEAAKVYYLITENLIDSATNKSMRTGNYYLCEVRSGSLYKCTRNDKQEYYLSDKLAEELMVEPVMELEEPEEFQDINTWQNNMDPAVTTQGTDPLTVR